MSEERGTLERVASEALEWGLGPTWGRLAPLSTGAVVTGAVMVGGAALAQRLVGARGRRLLAFVGGAALVPLALLILSSRSGDDEVDSDGGDESGDDEDGDEG